MAPLICYDLRTLSKIGIPQETVLCLGNFDGVHLAHRMLIRSAVELRNREFPRAVCGVFCFRGLSSDFLSENPPEHLSSERERLDLFRESGAEIAILAEFPTVRDLLPEDFAKAILRDTCHCSAVACGFNHRFGKGGSGTPELLSKFLPVTVQPPISEGGECVSSSRIRALLKSGEPEQAAKLLARPYSIEGEVLHGKQLGRKLGFPTANVNFPPLALIPRYGVYLTDCVVDGVHRCGVTNVGIHPTVDRTAQANCETYLPDFTGELYGKTVKIAFLRFIRPERCFSSTPELREQIAKDVETARKLYRQF